MKILLTATVTPQTTRILHVRDPQVRRQQYIESLRRWVRLAEQHVATVVFYENSGEDLDQLARDAFREQPGNLDLRSADAPDEDMVDRGKGAMEAAMMDDFAATYSDRAPQDEVWVKCTGRLFVTNLDRCLPAPVPTCALMARLSLDLAHMDTRFFAATAGAWQAYLTGAGPGVDMKRGVFIEHVLAKRVLGGIADGASLVRLRAQPAFLGRSGSYADRQYDSLQSRVKRLGTNALERALRGPLHTKHF
jgi:hypothetical protein